MAQSILSGKALGDFFSINWGFGIAVMLGIFVSGGVTGGHLNPAVTLAMAIGNKLRGAQSFFVGSFHIIFSWSEREAPDLVNTQ